MGLHSEVVGAFWTVAPAGLLAHRPMLDALVSASPYLRTLLEQHGDFVELAMAQDFETAFTKIIAECQAAAQVTPVDAMAMLRRAKAKCALLLALADVGRALNVMQIADALTRFADAAVQAAVDCLLREAASLGKFRLTDDAQPSKACGYVVLAMGKHGAHELNYSSDIDLIVFFDPETAPTEDAASLFVRMTKKLVSLLQDVTEDGYVFRVDLRLRPDPRATQVAIAIEAAAHYYENLGQNWERAAYIKARPIAGDIALGEEFLQRLTPYIWRKYLDFASIADVQSLIRQIHAVKGHGEVAVEGHNLKLGRGGIREIEFFVQTQQLIAGGRNAKLRGRRTLDMLQALHDEGWISAIAAAELSECYRFLRHLEHRAQMVDDQQTHLVPAAPDAFENYARFSGFASGDDLRVKLRATLETVKSHSASLFADTETLGSEDGSLVFTGGEDDPETLATLQRMGYAQASEISATIRGWHFGRTAATRTRRARELLTELMPALLKALARGGDADRSFTDFDRFLSGLPAGVQLFAMIKANPPLLELLALIIGTAPRLAEGLSKRPRVLEAVLEPGFFEGLPTRAQLHAQAAVLMPITVPLEELMDRARVFGREQQFRIGVRVLSDTLAAEAAGEAFADLADVLIDRMLQAACHDLATRHGRIAGGRVAVLAMGKLGGREMTATSDLDLIIVYDAPPDVAESDGVRPLSLAQYYAKLTQRLISALTVPTAEGQLYEVDLRLRPSGSKGPVAVSFSSFKTYQAESAWTWEKLALTRARPVAGDASLIDELRIAITHVLASTRDHDKTVKDIVDMRGLMLRELKPVGLWDLKRARGGLVELEFIAQGLQLLHAAGLPTVLHTNTANALRALSAAGVLTVTDSETLLAAFRDYHRLSQVLRLCLDTPYDPAVALPGLNRAVLEAVASPDAVTAEALILDHQTKVAELFDRLLGKP